MRSAITIIGVLLIIFGVATLAYKGFSYTSEDKIAQLGDLKLTTENQHSIYFPPILGGTSLAAGIILVVVGRIKFRK